MEGAWRSTSMNAQYLQHPVMLQESNDSYYNAEWLANRGSRWQDAGNYLPSQISNDVMQKSLVPFQRNDADGLRFQQIQYMNFTSEFLNATGSVPMQGYAGVMSQVSFEDSQRLHAHSKHLELAKIEGARNRFVEAMPDVPAGQVYPQKQRNQQIPSSSVPISSNSFTGYPFVDQTSCSQEPSCNASPSNSTLHVSELLCVYVWRLL